MNYSFTKLFSSITDSSIWSEDSDTRVVWVTMLAMADRKGRVFAAIPGLAKRAAVSIPKTEEAIQKFLSPDSYSRTADDEGRRIEVIEGGWRLINYSKYRELRDIETTRERKRKWAAKNRSGHGEKVDGVDKSRPGVDPSRPVLPQAEAEAEAENTPLPPTGGSVRPLPSLDRFDQFWSLYPRKVAKPNAQKRWVKLTDDERLAVIADVPRRSRCEQWQKDGGAYIPHPATYLGQRRWEDDPEPTAKPGAKPTQSRDLRDPEYIKQILADAL